MALHRLREYEVKQLRSLPLLQAGKTQIFTTIYATWEEPFRRPLYIAAGRVFDAARSVVGRLIMQ